MNFTEDEAESLSLLGVNELTIIGKLMEAISTLESKVAYLEDLVPVKYRKAFPCRDENPFFTLPLSEAARKVEFGAAKKRMEDLLGTTK